VKLSAGYARLVSNLIARVRAATRSGAKLRPEEKSPFRTIPATWRKERCAQFCGKRESIAKLFLGPSAAKSTQPLALERRESLQAGCNARCEIEGRGAFLSDAGRVKVRTLENHKGAAPKIFLTLGLCATRPGFLNLRGRPTLQIVNSIQPD
jgi:hypothetical protein